MNIIVTGASRGIGFELVKLFAKDQHNRILALARKKAGLEKLRQICAENHTGSKVTVIATDLSQGDLSRILLPEILTRMENIDILVNNAGILVNKPFELLEEEDFDLIFNSNVKTAYKLIRCLLPHFSKDAHIVNIGSMGGFQGSVKFPGLSLYSASKGALAILTECLAEEFKERNIRVNCLALGSAQTEMLEEAFPGYRSPLSAEEMAAFIADFSMNGQRWFNGKILPVSVSTP
ncbi:MAG: SDR family oxidoreductase [Bacteroidales bacterium]|jgi:NAD(P)-dependent dehydrogenase (short-subunit alcohol dehydrogenase family)|nr:SDR family oxidoreductase [Bacteroidales bacterium]